MVIFNNYNKPVKIIFQANALGSFGLNFARALRQELVKQA